MISNEARQEERLFLVEAIRSQTQTRDDWITRQALTVLCRLTPTSDVSAATKLIKSALNLAAGNGGVLICRDRLVSPSSLQLLC